VGSPTQALAKYLAKILQPWAEDATSYVKNSTHFVNLINDAKVGSDDLLVSFDIVSLFTKVPIEEALTTIKENHHVAEHIMELTRHCMKSTYFIYNKQFYKQVEGAPMGSPLSPVVANLFMADFETKALESAPLKPSCWWRYVDDIFVIWQHGKDELLRFLEHLNNQHSKIQFTMEVEVNGQLPFLDVLVKKKPNSTLSHTVYRKPTHTNRYLNAASHHHPTQIRAVAYTLATRSRRIADEDNMKAEAGLLREALLKNGFPNRLIHKALHRQPSHKPKEEKEEPRALAFLPYVEGTTDRISKLLANENIKTIFSTDRKIGDLLRSCKDHINLEGRGVYEIPCGGCHKTYIGQTGRNMSARSQEHVNAVDRGEKTSALAQHAKEENHIINFSGMRSLASVEYLAPRIIREAIEIERRPHTINKRDDGQRLPPAWKPVLSARMVTPIEPMLEAKGDTYPKHPRVDKRKRRVEQCNDKEKFLGGPITRSRTRLEVKNTSESPPPRDSQIAR
jgi:Reverse transcriptase (RNA-dependent DNA polymerase)